MATTVPLHSAIEKHLECPICHNRYRQPKVLNCQHSFCEECLVEYHESGFKDSPKVPCPVCRQETTFPKIGIQGLTTNLTLVGLTEDLEKIAPSKDSKLLSGTCKGDNEPSHHRIDAYKCHKHEGSVKQFYCKTCDEVICHSCIVSEHTIPVHDITESELAAKNFRESLNNKFPAFTRNIQFLEVCLLHTDEAKTSFNKNTAKTRQVVHDRAAEVIAQVKAEEKRIIDEIAVQELEQSKCFDEYKDKVNNLMERKKYSLWSAQVMTRNASDSDFLSLYPLIQNDIKNLNSQEPPKIQHKLWWLRFVKSHRADDINLGEVEQEGDKWEVLNEFGKQRSGDGEFELARGVAAAAEPDEIAVADCKNNRVVILDHRGFITRLIPVLSADVVATSNGWVCANPRKVFVYRRDTALAYEFYTVLSSDVGRKDVRLVSAAVMKNGNIIVGDKENKVLTEHEPGDGKILRTMPVEMAPDWLAVMSNGWVVISEEDQGRVGIVDVSDGNAIHVTTIRPIINGKQVEHCSGVVSNRSGIYIAADTGFKNTGHIHHYDCSGRFVSCIAEGLHNPCGITFTADGQQLVLADWYSVKIYHKV
ncbi:tripartite motif-containing protein 55-like [Acanthaster planci]|uniref:Tripartite motif-containing protein 55-like n=1 Tax=Acanthaster planci TaxID=133434 RepID=A0A8B7Z3D1_ACAPL|nr:tripartite motif-containing protein 55-like [Acanthaster planci]